MQIEFTIKYCLQFNGITRESIFKNCEPQYWNYYKDGKLEIYNLNQAKKKEARVLRENRKCIVNKNITRLYQQSVLQAKANEKSMQSRRRD